MNITGGRYHSGAYVIDNESGTVKIKNSYMTANYAIIYNGNYYVTKGTNNPGTIDICGSTIKGTSYDLYELNSPSYINYSNDNIFSNDTNTPASNKIYGTANQTNAACSW